MGYLKRSGIVLRSNLSLGHNYRNFLKVVVSIQSETSLLFITSTNLPLETDLNPNTSV